MTNTSATTSKASTRVRKLLSASFVAAFATAFTLGIANPTEARPMLTPCQYDNTCVTTTIRR